MAEKTKCEICDRTFKNAEGLEAHNKAKHSSPETEKKEKKPVSKKKIRNWSIFLVILIILSYWVFASVTATGEYDDFAQCLTEKGVKMYGAFWCPHCQDQKKEFGKSWKVFEKNNGYVECSTPGRQQTEECNSLGIQSYPTWEFADGKRQGGVFAISHLSQLSGCPLTTDG